MLDELGKLYLMEQLQRIFKEERNGERRFMGKSKLKRDLEINEKGLLIEEYNSLLELPKIRRKNKLIVFVEFALLIFV